MASECDAATVLAAAVSALHQVKEEEHSRTPRSMAQWAVVIGAFDESFDWEDSSYDDGPPVKRSRRVKERKDWTTSAWWVQAAPGHRSARLHH